VTIVFVDIDTQLDFLLPSGALYVPGAEKRVSAISRMNRYALEHGIVVLSTMDAHDENDPEFQHWPPHCIAGTLGQRKPECTLLPGLMHWRYEHRDLDIRHAKQIVVEKITTNCFECPNLAPILSQLNADRYVIYGVATEVCVKFAIEGFIQTGKKVELFLDAIQGLTPEGAEKTIREFQAAGGGISTTFA
jgi:nicotinamidase/pyrazinamidase